MRAQLLKYLGGLDLCWTGAVAIADEMVRDPRPAATHDPLPDTRQLTLEDDLASQMVAGVDKFLLREIDKSVERRSRHWKRDFSSADGYSKSLEPNRKRLAHILGVRDPRVPFDAPELVATTA